METNTPKDTKIKYNVQTRKSFEMIGTLQKTRNYASGPSTQLSQLHRVAREAVLSITNFSTSASVECYACEA